MQIKKEKSEPHHWLPCLGSVHSAVSKPLLLYPTVPPPPLFFLSSRFIMFALTSYKGSTSHKQMKQYCISIRWGYWFRQRNKVNEAPSILEFFRQYRLHCRWDKISLEGTDDLHSKDKTVAQQQHSTMIPQLSGAQIPQQRPRVCLCVCVCAFPPTQCLLSLQFPSFVSEESSVRPALYLYHS